jgi:hypothetical protein
LLFAYDFDNQWATGELDYIYDRWNPSFKLNLRREALRFRDDSDDLRRVRMEQAVTGELIFPMLWRSQQWTFHLGAVHNEEYDKWRDTGVPAAPTLTDDLLGTAVSYNSSNFYPKSISPSDGQLARLVAEDSDTLNSDFTGQVYTLDWRGYLSLTHRHVLAVRLAGGWGTDNPRPFRLGGATDGYFIARPAGTLAVRTEDIFGKREYALRGYKTGLDALRGRRMALGELEWRFPIALIERGWMAPPVGVNQIYGKVFYDTGEAWRDSFQSSDLLHGAGLEVNTEVVIGYAIPLNLRVGYAHGFDDVLGEDQAYLSVGGTF